MDKKNILIKPLRRTVDYRAIILKFRYETEVNNFLNLLKFNIPNFKRRFFCKLYNKIDNMFIKNIGEILKNKIKEEDFKMELFIVSITGGGNVQEVVEFMDKEDTIIIYHAKEKLFTEFFNFNTKKED